MAVGVYTAYKKDNTEYYRVSLTCKNKHISLGSFDDYALAGKVYKEADSILRNNAAHEYRHFIDPADYTTSYGSCSSPLSFEKFVILVNLRDNGIYIKTPIYLCEKYFLYFLTPKTVLKFDIEDLFYYSSHKIMIRGGYYFVNDYGMQTSILSRYGIRNHSVKGKDYIFRNGDDKDYRYENVCIINRYNGVSRTEKDGRIMYQSRIHINGDYIIGYYSTEDEAAIAYNKTVDLLSAVSSVSYTPNYIENISPIAYAAAYNSIKISKKLLNYINSL